MTDKIVVSNHDAQNNNLERTRNRRAGEVFGSAKFRPPEEVAAAEEQTGGQSTASPLLHSAPRKKRSLGGKLKDWWKALSKPKKFLFASLGVALVIAIAVSAYFGFFAPNPAPAVEPVKKEQPKEPPKPTTVPSNLTGLQVNPSINDRPVTAVMIENSMAARPQAGLLEADVVFEAITEGGITRFMALYQDAAPEYVGPVRSARPHFIQWLMGFDAAYAHAGGSAEALSLINQWGVKDLPHHSSYYWRINGRVSPHNLYTSIPKLHEYEASKGFGKAVYTPLPRKEKEAPVAVPTAKSIDFNISSHNYNVHYDYDPATNTYHRVMGGAPHTADPSGAQIAPKVVVALVMPQGRNGIYYTYQTIGSGQAFIFQDGVVIGGTWKKDNNSANFTFTDPNGDEIKLNPGQTWFTALGDAGRVTYTP